MGKETELLEAARTGDDAAVEKILANRTKSKGLSAFASLRRGISPNIQDGNGDTPLHIASLNGHSRVVETLLRLDASANMMDNKGCYPLHLAAWTGNHDICNILLTQGPSIAQVNEQNNEGDTALHYACQYGHTHTVSVLLQKCADSKLRNKRSESPLDLAAQYGHLDSVKLLLVHDGSLVNDKTPTKTPLHLAARNGHKHIVKELIDAGFDINTTTETGSALHEAVLYGKQDVIKVLLQHEINAELKNSEGNTALHSLEDFKSERTIETKNMIEDYIKEKKVPLLDRMSVAQQNYDQLYDVPSTLVPVPIDQDSGYDNLPNPVDRKSSVEEREGRAPPPDTSPPDIPKLTKVEERPSSIYDVPVNITHTPGDMSSDQSSPKPLKGYVLISSHSNSPTRSPEVPQKPPRKKLPASSRKPSSERQDSGNSDGRKGSTSSQSERCASPKPATLDLECKRDCAASPTPQSPTGYVQPPTPDFPPPSPQSAFIGIQEKINPNDKRRSQNIETCTEAEYLAPTPDSIDQSLPSDQSCSSLTDTSDFSPCGEAPPANLEPTDQDIETYDNVDIMASSSESNENEFAKLSLDDKTKVTADTKKEKDNNNESTKKNFNPFLGLIKGSNPKGTRRVTTQLYDNVNPQLLSKQGSPSKRSSVPLNYVHYDPVPIVKEQPETIVEVGDTRVMMRPKKPRDSTRSTRVDTNNGVPAKEEVLDDDAEWAQIADIISSFGGHMSTAEFLAPALHSENAAAATLTGGKKIQSVGDWLDDIGLSQYENGFVANGFDDMDFLGKNVLDDNDLLTIGVLSEHHRRTILTAAQSIHPVIPMNDDNLPSSVEEWLQSLRLEDYSDNFTRNQYTTIERVRKIWEMELNVLDITVLGHRKRILASLGNRPDDERLSSLRSSGGSSNLEWSCSPLTAVAKSSEEESLASSTSDIDLFKDYSGVKPKYEGLATPASPSENSPMDVPPAIPPRRPSQRSQSDGVDTEFLHIRPPQLTAMQSPVKQWRHKPEVLIKGCCNYSSQYLGSCLVTSLQGTDSTKEGIRKMKKATANVAKTPQIMLSISYRGVKFIDAKTRRVVSEHEVSNIFCACQDGNDMNYFAYITKDLQTNKLYCHVFRVKTMELAAEIILTLGEAFEVAYQVAMKEKAAASAMEFERKLSESGASSSGTGTM